MAVTAKIKFTQGLADPPAGEALIGTAGVPVVCSNADNSNVATLEWEVLDKPPTSAVGSGVQASGQVPFFEFIPDQPGGYHIHLTTVDLAGNKAEDFRVFQVPEPSGFLIPPFLARAPALNWAGNTRGWAKPIEELLRYLLTGAAPVGGAVNWGARRALGNTTMSATDTVIAVDTLAMPITVTLPASPGLGRVAVVYDYSGNTGPVNTLTVRPSGAGTIVGQPSYVFAEAFSGAMFVYDGAVWNIVGAFPAGGGGGGGGGALADLVFAASAASEGAGTWTRAGVRTIDLSHFPPFAAGKTRSIRFVGVLENASAAPAYTAQARLFDLDAGVAVTGSQISNAAAPAREVTAEYAVPLTPGVVAGTLRSDTVHLYEVQFRANGTLTPPGDRAILSGARLEIAYL